MTNNEAAKWIQLYIDLAKIDPTTGEAAYLNDNDKKIIEAMEMAISALKAQEKAQEVSNDSPELDNKFGDLISRQAATDAVRELYIQSPKISNDIVYDMAIDQAHDALVKLPSAQPDLSGYSDRLWKAAYERGKADAQAEIVQCKDCIFHGLCRTSPKWAVAPKDDWYCADAERRTDGVDS